MTSNYSLTGIKAFALGAALSMTAGLALAGDNVISADQITRALQPKPLTRGLSGGTQIDTAAQAKETKFVDSLRNRKSRSLSLGDPRLWLGVGAIFLYLTLRKLERGAAEERTVPHSVPAFHKGGEKPLRVRGSLREVAQDDHLPGQRFKRSRNSRPVGVRHGRHVELIRAANVSDRPNERPHPDPAESNPGQPNGQ